MYWDNGWAWMVFMPLLWIALTGLVVWALVRLAQGSPGRESDEARWPRRETPGEILDRRFASGEIDAEAYADARERLEERRSASP